MGPEQQLTTCTSEPKLALFGKVPPRTPGRSDSQTPSDLSLGAAKHARFPHVYFYAEPEREDAVFGLLDIEVALQLRRDGSVWLEAYCIGDGFQSGRASGREYPLTVEIMQGTEKLGEVRWHYPPVLCGHFDPMTFATKTDLTPRDFAAADHIALPPAKAMAGSCKGAPPTSGAPDGHDH
jgi:hypothetical protein